MNNWLKLKPVKLNTIMQAIIKFNHMVELYMQVVCVDVCFCAAIVNICICTFQVKARGFIPFQMHLKMSQPVIQNAF